MKKTLFALALLAAAAQPALAAGPPPQPQVQPRILLIDRQAILRQSKVGQDVAKQVQTYADQAKADIAGQQKALQTEAQQLQQQVAILAADARQKKVQAFEAKQAGMQATAQKREAAIQGGFMKAQQTIAQTLEPILNGLMQQRGANMILDKNAVVFASPDAVKAFDITQAAVAQLDQKLPSLKVTLATAPAPGQK
ncbi:MAG TPA: OmpH family outer membrane protein [Rhizomicrobium sp.]|jgi:Skp family chaperone for outer membrane proteins|nr:OmpH family outer membrane protein [Rhizomicrobium sp.]